MVKINTSKATSQKPKAGSIWKSLGISNEHGLELQDKIRTITHDIAEESQKTKEGIRTTDIIKKFNQATKGMDPLEKTAVIHLGTSMLNVMANPLSSLLHMIR